MNTKGDYIPGTCNIGPAEIKARRNVALVSAIISVGLIIILPLIHADKILRLVVFFPATSAGVGFQQWYNHFCVAFGLKGVFNFGDIGKTFTVEQKENFKKDRTKAQKMISIGVLFGLVIAILFYILPLQ
jgi:hypothetical protein